MAYNLGILWRGCPVGPVLPNRIDNWSLTSLQERLVKTGGRLMKHARCHWLLLAESHLTRRLFRAMVGRIAALPVPAGQTGAKTAPGVRCSSSGSGDGGWMHTEQAPVGQSGDSG